MMMDQGTKMGDTLALRKQTTSIAGGTARLNHQNSESASIMGIGYTPSIMSPMKGMNLNLGGPETTLYSMQSPPTRLHGIHDPVREVDENIREQQEILKRKLDEKRKNR